MRIRIPLAEIEVLPSGRLALTIASDPKGLAPFIYRAAAEISWEPDRFRFVSPRPELGPPLTHFRHVSDNVADELGYVLATTSATKWINVPTDDRAAIEAAAATGT